MVIAKPREEKPYKQMVNCGFEFFKMRPIPSFSLAAHSHFHDAIECIYMTEGCVKVYIDGRVDRLSAGDLILFRSRGIHTMYTEDAKRTQYYVLKVNPALLHRISPSTVGGRFCFRFSVFNPSLKHIWRKEELEGGAILSHVNKLIENLKNPTGISDVSMILAALSVLEEMFAQTETEFSALSQYSDLIHRATVHINEHFSEDISEKELAQSFGLSYAYFSRAFKAATGKSFRDYLSGVRINQAQQLMVNTDLSVADVAAKCGYGSVSHFISAYKRAHGTSPLQARKRSRKPIKPLDELTYVYYDNDQP